MRTVILSGSAQPALAGALCGALDSELLPRTLQRFPDGEMRVVLEEPVRGAEVYVVQPLGPPADVHLFELLLLADACRRGGAARVVAVVPYLAWARQDRRRSDGEPNAARLAADLVSSRADLALAVDVHGAAAEGLFSVPFEHLTAIPLLASAFSKHAHEPVVVAPDLGAMKRAEDLAERLGAPVAHVHKTRVSPREVRARLVAGDVAGRAPIVVDDMITTGATVDAAVRVLLEAGCRPEITVVATHALLVEDCVSRLARLPLARVVVTDSVAIAAAAAAKLPLEIVSLGPLLAEAVRRLRGGGELGPLRART